MALKSDAKFEEKLICLKNDKNLVNFDLRTQSSQNVRFDWFPLSKVYNVWPKIVQRSYLTWHWRVMQNLKKNWLVVWKMTWGIWQILIRTLESVKIWTLIGSLCPKKKMHELKIYRGVEEWWKICSGIDFSFQNWHEEFGKFSSEHSKVSKTLMFSFWEDYMLFELKKDRGVIVHDTEEWCKIWRGIDLLFQNWYEEFDKFWPKHSKVSKTYTLMGPFWPKYIMFELKKYRGIMFDRTKDWCKIWRKTDFRFQKWHEEFGKFSKNSKNKNSKQPDWWSVKTLFYLGNKWIAKLTKLFTHVLQNRCS